MRRSQTWFEQARCGVTSRQSLEVLMAAVALPVVQAQLDTVNAENPSTRPRAVIQDYDLLVERRDLLIKILCGVRS